MRTYMPKAGKMPPHRSSIFLSSLYVMSAVCACQSYQTEADVIEPGSS